MQQIRRTNGEKAFDVLNVCFMVLLSFAMFYPFYYMLIYSFNVGEASRSSLYFWPTEFTLDNYTTLLKNEYITNAYLITVLRTVLGTAVHVLFTSLVAYGLADLKLAGRKVYTIIFLVPMFFGGGLVPTYLLIIRLGLVDNFLVYIVPAMFSVWNMILLRTYFQNLPTSLEESARIDGARDITVFLRIILPMSTPVVAAISLFAAVGQWNAWFDAFLYVNNPKLHPIQLFLKTVIQQNVGVKNLLNSLASSGLDPHALKELEQMRITTESMKAAATIITIGPIILVYPFLQKYFVKGIMLGSIKG